MHDEAQCHDGADPAHVAGILQSASFRPCRSVARLCRIDRGSGSQAPCDQRLRRGVAAAQLRRSGGICRTTLHSRLSSQPRRKPPRPMPHSLVRAWHQSGVGTDGWNARRRRQLRRERECRSRRSARQGGKARGPPGRDHGDLSLHARRVRGGNSLDLRHRACRRRPGLSRRGQSQCAGRPGAARRLRSRCQSFQSAQDILHSPWRRRAGYGPDRREGSSCPVPAGSSVAARPTDASRPRFGGTVRLRVHSPDLVGLYRPHGRRRPDQGDESRHPERQLYRGAARNLIIRCCTRGNMGGSRTSAFSISAR